MIISVDFSNELISRMSVRKSYELIDSLNSLIKSGVKVLTFGPHFLQIVRGRNVLLNQIADRIISHNTFIGMSQFMQEDKWMRQLMNRECAFLSVETPFKMRLIQISSQMDNIKIKTIDDSTITIKPVITLRRNLTERPVLKYR